MNSFTKGISHAQPSNSSFCSDIPNCLQYFRILGGVMTEKPDDLWYYHNGYGIRQGKTTAATATGFILEFPDCGAFVEVKADGDRFIHDRTISDDDGYFHPVAGISYHKTAKECWLEWLRSTLRMHLRDLERAKKEMNRELEYLKEIEEQIQQVSALSESDVLEKKLRHP